jgi:peptide/nickel transport system ATP-binding protein
VARESETVAIVGESGCGKSTLAKVLLGLETASSGGVRSAMARSSRPASKARRADGLVDPDGVPEPVRHAQSQPFGRLADHPHAGKFGVGKTVAERASACWNCSIW